MTTIILSQLSLHVRREAENQGGCMNNLNNKTLLAQLSDYFNKHLDTILSFSSLIFSSLLEHLEALPYNKLFISSVL